MSKSPDLRDVIISELLRALSIRPTPQETKRELAIEAADRILNRMGVNS